MKPVHLNVLFYFHVRIPPWAGASGPASNAEAHVPDVLQLVRKELVAASAAQAQGEPFEGRGADACQGNLELALVGHCSAQARRPQLELLPDGRIAPRIGGLALGSEMSYQDRTLTRQVHCLLATGLLHHPTIPELKSSGEVGKAPMRSGGASKIKLFSSSMAKKSTRTRT